MAIFLGILAIWIIPSLLNMIYMYITVKFGLWNWVAEIYLHDDGCSKKIEKDTIEFMMYPPLSIINSFGIVIFNVGTLIYYIVSYIIYPFEKLVEFISTLFLKDINRIENKREFYKELNKK